MTRLPKLADVQCQRLKFEPGDRVIVRVHAELDRDQKSKLRKTVQRWAGSDTEVLLVDMRMFDIEVDSARRIV